MYTLEDDQETSASLQKRDFANLSAVPEDQGSEGVNERTPDSSTTAHDSIPEQITNSFKKLTSPGQNVINKSEKRVAVAALIIACIGVFFTALDQTVVVTALSKIIADPGINIPFTQLDHAAWIISAYLLGFIIAMPLMGRVSDIYGRRRIFLLCLSIFGLGSILCGLAPTLGQSVDLSFLSNFGIDVSSPGLIFLVSARFIQAIGGGAVVPVAMAIVSDFYGKERLALALGIIGAVTEAGGVMGPLYGALIVQHLGWTYIFFFNVPIVLALMAGAWFLIPKGKRLHEGIDWLGAILLGLMLTCLSLGLAQQGTELGPTAVNSSSPQNNPLSLILALVFLLAFIVVELVPRWRVPRLSLSRHFPFLRLRLVQEKRWPVVDLSLFKRLPFSASSLVSLFVGVALIIAMADIPLFVDTVLSRHINEADIPLVSGLALLRLTAMIPVGALLGGWLSSRISCRFTGVLGLLFVATGFYLMSRWSMTVDWTQITISTMTTGLGFGLVIAPISTTAIKAVRATQAGMGAAIVTSLRMVGMMLGLAALTSWALAYFKQLASQFPSLPVTATTDQFAQWSKDYANHLIISAHSVYSSVFFATMILCLIAIIPAFFLWGNKAPVEELVAASTDPLEVTPSEPETPMDDTIPVAASAAGTFLVASDVLDDVYADATPPIPPVPDNVGGGGSDNNKPKSRRRLLIAIASIALVLFLVLGGVFAAFMWQPSGSNTTGSANNPATGSTQAPTATPVSGPRMIEIALDQTAMNSLFISQLGLNQGAITDMNVMPVQGDGVVLSLNLHINASGIHRVMPIELDSTIGVNQQQNITLHVLHLKRDGIDAGPTAAARMEQALNQLLLSSLMPSLHNQLKNAQIISVHTSTSIVCGKGTEMLVLLIKAPPIDGVAAQPTPTALCFKGPIDLNKLFPN
ncbi:MAG: MFS transporter [Ktedonobacteraceae bacterium]